MIRTRRRALLVTALLVPGTLAVGPAPAAAYDRLPDVRMARLAGMRIETDSAGRRLLK